MGNNGVPHERVPVSCRPLDLFWFIPTHGDGSYLGSETQQRTVCAWGLQR
jgi:alkanesulfonate monooxygenase